MDRGRMIPDLLRVQESVTGGGAAWRIKEEFRASVGRHCNSSSAIIPVHFDRFGIL